MSKKGKDKQVKGSMLHFSKGRGSISIERKKLINKFLKISVLPLGRLVAQGLSRQFGKMSAQRYDEKVREE
jgi:invasion protein IalB